MHRAALGASAAASAGALAFLQRNFAVDSAQSPLPKGSKVLIVGAGVVGVTTARELARRGYSVRVIEQGAEVCSTEAASWGCAGTLSRDRRTAPLSATPLKIVEGLVQSWRATAPEDGHGVFFDGAALRDPYFWLWGLTYLRAHFGSAHSRFLDGCWRKLNAAAQGALFAVAAEEGLTSAADMRIGGRCYVSTGAAPRGEDAPGVRQLLAREPSVLTDRVALVDVAAHDGQGSCADFSRGLARVCERKYAVAFEVGVAARALLLDGAGTRIVGVRTASGESIEADAVVLCAGACVAPLAATAGLYVPVQPLRGYSLTADVSPQKSSSSVRNHVVFQPSSLFVARLGSQLRFTCYGEMTAVRMDGPGVPSGELQAALHRLVEAQVPNVAELCDWSRAVGWHGARPLTPDCQPLSGATRISGLFLNVGHSFNGWREAALSARVLADAVGWVGTAAPECARRAYDPARFQLWA